MIPAIHRRIAIYVYPGFDLLDLAGTTSVFTAAAHQRAGSYVRRVISARGGPVVSSSGVCVDTDRTDGHPVHSLIVLGGALEIVRSPPDEILAPIVQLAAGAQRVVSTCTGAFLLGGAGLLDGKQSTTHWLYALELQSRYPATRVQKDKIFVNDGALWTSAGGSATVDLSLALIEDDLGVEIARKVAHGLVIYHRRPGGQSRENSAMLELDPKTDRIRQALGYARDHLHEKLTVGQLAGVACLSERQFSRAFVAETGTTPAKAVERLRVETAHALVQDGRQPIEVIARAVGFSEPEQMRQAFIRTYGRSPQSIRKEGRAGAESAAIA